MRNNENSLAFNQSGNRVLDFSFVVYVKGCSCFIQQDNRCIFQQCTGNGKSLTFAAGKCGAVFSDHRLVSLRKSVDKFITHGSFCRCDYFLICCVLSSYTDIFHNRVIEQYNILKNNREIFHQHGRIQRFNVSAAEQDFSAIQWIKLCCQFGNCTFSAAGRSYQCGNLSLFCSKGYVTQYWFVLFVREFCVIKCNIITIGMDIFFAVLIRILFNLFQTFYQADVKEFCHI